MLLILVEFRNLFQFIGKSFGIKRTFPYCFKNALDHLEGLTKVFFILAHLSFIRL